MADLNPKVPPPGSAHGSSIAARTLDGSYIGQQAYVAVDYFRDDDGLHYVYGWAEIRMITHTSKGLVKIRVFPTKYVDFTYEASERIWVTRPKVKR